MHARKRCGAPGCEAVCRAWCIVADDDVSLVGIAEAYDQAGGDRKRNMAQMAAVADEHGHEGEEEAMAKVRNLTCLHIATRLLTRAATWVRVRGEQSSH